MSVPRKANDVTLPTSIQKTSDAHQLGKVMPITLFGYMLYV